MSLTLVTCLFDLASRESSSRRTLDQYLKHGEYVLGLDQDIVFFVDPSIASEIQQRRARFDHRTLVIPITLEDLDCYKYLESIKRGKKTQNANPIKDSDLYILLGWAKFELLQRAAAFAKTSHLGWIDFGIAHVAAPPTDDPFSDPPDKVRLHVMRYFDRNDTKVPDYWQFRRGHVAPGFMIGSTDNIAALACMFYQTAEVAITHNYSPNEDCIVPVVVDQDPSRFVYSYGDYADILTNARTVHTGGRHLLFMLKDARDRKAWDFSCAIGRQVITSNFDAATLEQLLTEYFIAAYYKDVNEAAEIANLYAEKTKADPDFRKAFKRNEKLVRSNFAFLKNPPSLDLPRDPNSKLLGLMMVVKNEAYSIRETLLSVRDHIDYWTVLDTGSTDGTQAIVKEVMAGVPGELFEEAFVDFSTTYNRGLELHRDKTEFVLHLLGDETVTNAEKLREVCVRKAYAITLHHGDTHYRLPRLLPTNDGWYYIGRTHEHLTKDGDSATDREAIKDCYITRGTPPDNLERKRNRWELDKQILEEDLAKNPNDSRALFYLAQTYDCLGDHTKALELYERRIEVGGWFEETFEAKLRRASMMGGIGKPWEAIQQAYLDAYSYSPSRAEPLYKIAKHWYDLENHTLAFLFGQRAAALPYPNAGLFVDAEVYEWKANDLIGISGYYVGEKAVGKHAAELAVKAKPNDQRLRNNWAFYSEPASKMFDGYSVKELAFKPEAPYSASNPSIWVDGNQRLCVIRSANYEIVDGAYLTAGKPITVDNAINTRNYMAELDGDYNVTNVTEMLDLEQTPRSNYPVHGYEDCRLFRLDDGFYCLCVVLDFSDGDREIALLKLDDKYRVVRATPLRGPWSDRCQKNWVPRVGRDHESQADIIYSTDRAVMFSCGKSGVVDTRGCTNFDHGRLRGGSQAVQIRNGWLHIVHDVAFISGRSRTYLHRFVQMSEDNKLVGMSDAFYFEKHGIEFCAGLALDNDKLIASYSVDDKCAKLAFFDLTDVLKAIRQDFVI